MAEGALRELLLEFGVEVDDKALESFEEGLGGVVERVKHYGQAIVGFLAVGELKEFFEGTIEQVARLADTSERLGVGVEELQKFQFTAKLAGVDAETAAHSLGLFNRQIGEALAGSGEAAQTFRKLGISLKETDGSTRPLIDVVGDVGDAIKDMDSQQERAALAMKLFGRAGQAMLPILQGGREKIEKQGAELEKLGGLMGEDFVKSAKQADDELVKMHVAFQGLRTRAVATFLPMITELIKRFQGWVVAAQQVLEKTHLLEDVFSFIKLAGMVKGVMMLVDAMKALAAGEGLVDLLDPFTLMAAALLGVFLIFQDLMTAARGGKSVIGDALGKDSPELLQTLADAAHDLSDAWTQLKPDFVQALKDLLPAVVELVKLTAESIAGIALAIHDVKAAIDDLGPSGGAKTQRAQVGQDIAMINAGQNFLAAARAESARRAPGGDLFVGPATPQEKTAAGGGLVLPEIKVEGGKGGGGTQQQIVQHNQIKIEVTGSDNGDTNAVGAAVGQGVTKALEQEKIDALAALKKK